MTNTSDFSSFLDLVEFADVKHIVTKDDGVTVLAPNNQAFNKIDSNILEELYGDKEQAKKVRSLNSLSLTKIMLQMVLRHTLTEVLCCSAISRNNGIFFNNSRKRALSGSLIAVSYANIVEYQY